MRDELEDAFGIDALDSYGLSEVVGPGVAGECVETKDGLHIWEDHFYPEIIDPATGAVLPDGAFGEIVFTSLTKEAMPVIRYRTGDLTRLLPGTARSMRRMEKVSGRTDDMMIVRGVNVFPTQIEELVLGVPSLSAHYQLVLSREGRLDGLEVQVEARSLSELDQARAHAASELAHAMKARIGVTADVKVLKPGQIERSLGKAKRVIDNRPRT
jgi:phenylacetate-CoA ligase